MTIEPKAIDYERLFKLRLTVARVGEMDLAKWWNTSGQLGRVGAAALRRGFPRTHYFAQARTVFAVAGQRCREIFDPPQCATLWHLTEQIEDAFDERWEGWLDNYNGWQAFFKELEVMNDPDLGKALLSLGLISKDDLEAVGRLRRASESRALPLPRLFYGTDEDITLLAAGFTKSGPGSLSVPYAQRAG